MAFEKVEQTQLI